MLWLKDQAPHRQLNVGAFALVVGIGITAAALSPGSPVLFFAGNAISGIGFGAGFQGGLRSVLASANAIERAGVLAVVLIIAYLAMGLPAMGAGYLLSQGRDIVATTHVFAALVVVLAAVAALGAAQGRPRVGPAQTVLSQSLPSQE